MYDIMKGIWWLLKTFILTTRKWLAHQILDEINAIEVWKWVSQMGTLKTSTWPSRTFYNFYNKKNYNFLNI